MQAVYFLILAVGLYVFSDWLLQRVEDGSGKRLESRSLIFFAIYLLLLLSSFAAVQRFVGG